MKRDEGEHASFGNKWIPMAGALGMSVGQGRHQGDKGGWGTAKTWITEGLECHIKASGLHLQINGEPLNGLK